MTCGCGDNDNGKMYKNKIDMSNISKVGDEVAKKINSGVREAEKELETVSFIKKSSKADRSNNDPFAKIGL